MMQTSKITYSNFSVAFFAVLIFLTFAIDAQTNAIIKTPEVSYKIKPVPLSDRTNLEISVEFKAKNSEPFVIKLPTDNFGTPDLYKYVTSLEGESGTLVKPVENAKERIVVPAPDGNVRLRYMLSYDPKEMDRFAFAPNTGAAHFNLAGCQWLLHIGGDGVKRRFNVEIVGAPKGWKFYSSKSSNAKKFEIEASYDDWIAAPIGGGENYHNFDVNGGRVSVFVHGEYEIQRTQIFSSIETIIRLERGWFNDFSQADFTIAVAPRSSVVAGYAPENSFVLFIKPDATPEQLNRIIAHELFHTWLPNKIRIVQDKRFSGIRFEWFTEGFTDYFARKILAEAGLMTESQFVDSINLDLLSIADNPHKSKTYDELAELSKAGKYDAAAKKLAYFRGAVIALDWDARLKRSGKNIDLSHFIRELYKLAQKTGGKISEDAFYDFAAGFGIDARGDFEKFIAKGEKIVPSADAFGTGYELIETEKPSFDIGFALDETFKTRKISGVKAGSAAFKAGFRDGMEFLSIENSNRFSNAWSAEKPMIVHVLIDGKKETFEYFPLGQKITVQKYMKVSR